MRGLSEQFISDYLAEFIPHWKASGKVRAEWDSTFTRQAIEQWEQRAHRRTNQPAPQADDCPVAEIVKVWNRAMPTRRVNPDVVISNSTGDRIRSKWASMEPGRQTLEFMAAFFARMSKEPKFMKESYGLTLHTAFADGNFDQIDAFMKTVKRKEKAA